MSGTSCIAMPRLIAVQVLLVPCCRSVLTGAAGELELSDLAAEMLLALRQHTDKAQRGTWKPPAGQYRTEPRWMCYMLELD